MSHADICLYQINVPLIKSLFKIYSYLLPVTHRDDVKRFSILLGHQLLPPGGITPLGKGIRGTGPFVPGVWEIGLIGDRGTGDGGIWIETVPLLIEAPFTSTVT